MGSKVEKKTPSNMTWADLEKASKWLDSQNQTIDSLDLTDLLDPDECPYNVDNLLEELMNAEDLDELHRLERCSTASSDRQETSMHVRQPSTSAILQSTGLDDDDDASSFAGSETSEACRRRSHTGTYAPLPVPINKTMSPSNSLNSSRTASPSRAAPAVSSAPASVAASPARKMDTSVQSPSASVDRMKVGNKKESLLRWLKKRSATAKMAELKQEEEPLPEPEFKQLPTKEAVTVAW